MAGRDDDIGDWTRHEASQGLAVAGWGLAGVTAFVLAFASWQYAPLCPTAETARAEVVFDPSDVTGSISGDRLRAAAAGFTVGAGRAAPSPLSGSDTVATSRDIERLRGEIRDLQRRLALLDVAGGAAARRLDRLEAQVPPPATAGVLRPVAALEPTPDKSADRLPTPRAAAIV